MSGARYAIFFVPLAGGALYEFGAAALGYDSYSGLYSPDGGPTCDDALRGEEWAQLTAEPRKYGFHATLKAPFRLRSEVSERHLIAELMRLAATHAPPDRFVATITLLDGFAALVPSAPAPTLDLLAGNCVRAFDKFRDQMTAAERNRRLAHPLTLRQIDHLDRWGYPYVFEDFRFHMTLTGRLPVDRAAQAVGFLRGLHRRSSVPAEIVVDTIALLRQDGPDVPFRVIASAPLPVQSAAQASAG
jgi:hypothetical protein